MTWERARTGPVYRVREPPIEPLGEDLLARGERRRAAEFLRRHHERQRDRGWDWIWESWMTTTDRECWR